MRKADVNKTSVCDLKAEGKDDFDPFIDIEMESWHDTSIQTSEGAWPVPIDCRLALNAEGRPSLSRYEKLVAQAEAVRIPNAKVVFFIMRAGTTRTDSLAFD